jgi:hypothetical protein
MGNYYFYYVLGCMTFLCDDRNVVKLVFSHRLDTICGHFGNLGGKKKKGILKKLFTIKYILKFNLDSIETELYFRDYGLTP